MTTGRSPWGRVGTGASGCLGATWKGGESIWKEVEGKSASFTSLPISCASLTQGLGLSNDCWDQFHGVNTAGGAVPVWAIFGPEQWDKRAGGWHSGSEQTHLT